MSARAMTVRKPRGAFARIVSARIVSAATLVLVFGVAACADDTAEQTSLEQTTPSLVAGPAPATFDNASGFLRTSSDSIPLQVDIAATDEQRAFGLMDRDQLADDAGMIFLYEQQQPGTSGFWMFRTRIPLDIAFLDGAGRIVAIRHMEPCMSTDQNRCMELARDYNPGEPYFGALEVNAGYFEEHGVVVGDRFVLPGRIGG